MRVRALLAVALFVGAAPAVQAQAMRVPQPDLVVTGLSCEKAHPIPLFSFSLTRGGELTFSGVAGVRELGDRSAQLSPEDAEKVLKLAATLRHQRDSKAFQDTQELCVRIVQHRDTRP